MSAADMSLTSLPKGTAPSSYKASKNVTFHVPFVLRKLLEDTLREATEEMGNQETQRTGEASNPQRTVKSNFRTATVAAREGTKSTLDKTHCPRNDFFEKIGETENTDRCEHLEKIVTHLAESGVALAVST